MKGKEDRKMNIFPQRLTQLRLAHQLSQKNLAKGLYVSTSAISNYEQSIRSPDIWMLVRIADYFDVSTDYLLGRTDRRQ